MSSIAPDRARADAAWVEQVAVALRERCDRDGLSPDMEIRIDRDCRGILWRGARRELVGGAAFVEVLAHIPTPRRAVAIRMAGDEEARARVHAALGGTPPGEGWVPGDRPQAPPYTAWKLALFHAPAAEAAERAVEAVRFIEAAGGRGGSRT